MSEHFTLRFPNETAARLHARAKRTRTPPRTLAQRYVEEGLRRDEHPLISFADGPSGRRARLLGTGLDVWEVIATVRDNDNDDERATSYLEVPLGLIQAAIAYYGHYREEIDDEIAANEAEWARGFEALEAGQRALGR